MKNRLWKGFLMGALVVQFLVIVNLILSQENAAMQGVPIRLTVRPVDPYDPFRGRYVTLDLQLPEVDNGLPEGASAYLLLERSTPEVLEVSTLSPVEPTETVKYLKVRVRSSTTVSLEPLKFFLQEDHAQWADTVLNRILWRGTDPERRAVLVELAGLAFKGEFMATSLLLDGMPLGDYIRLHPDGP